MENMKDKEGFMHAIVKEFLDMVGYEEAVSAYIDELRKNGMTLNEKDLPDQMDEKSAKIQESFLKTFTYGNYKSFWLLWNEHIDEELRNENDTQRLEFRLHLYFTVFPIVHEENRLSPIESCMQEFKNYLETNGAALSQTTEFVAFYALPFVPNPKNHPTFKELFEVSWREEVKEALGKFLVGALHSEPLPYLYKLYIGALQDQKKVTQDHAKGLNALKQQAREHELQAKNYFHKFAKLQGDYHNLIGIAAELVDSLEKCVRGQMITPEYLQEICVRLFGQTTVDMSQNIDFTRPGTAAHLLRASVSHEVLPFDGGGKQTNFLSLDFNRIKADLEGTISSRKKTLLLQSLTWRMTKCRLDERESVISSYISNDILGCNSKATVAGYVTEIYEADDEHTSEYLSRFINTVASFAVGRQYLAHSGLLIKKLIRVIMKSKHDSAVSENVLGALQKLSLRRHVQSILIDSAVIEWLFKMLEEPDNLSDYALEYTVALLMNLCLRIAGKKKCCLHPEKILKILLDLLSFENVEVRPYINGTLYSVLALPSIKAAAHHMGMEEILNIHMQDETQDQHQLKFILKQLNTVVAASDDDVESDGEDDDDDDEEGDAVEAESEKEETISVMKGELSGEDLLRSEYSNEISKPSAMKSKKLRASLDEPFTRPVTPARKPTKVKSNIDVPNRPSVDVYVTQERPRTSSARGRTRPPSEQAGAKKNSKDELLPQNKSKPGKTFKQAFTSRPKIPRTPDTSNGKSSRPTSSTEVPPLTRSMSPTRPSSGKVSKISPR